MDEKVISHIHKGDLLVFPTDTVYGIGCNPFNVEALHALFAAKMRPPEKGIPVLVSSIAKAHELGHITPACEALLAKHWPGALTVVVKQRVPFPSELSSDDTIALRMPNHALALQIINEHGGALAVSSANISGNPPARTANEARRSFARIPNIRIIDGGITLGGVPSSIVDCTKEPFTVLRQGPISV